MVKHNTRRRKTSRRTELLQLNRVATWEAYQTNLIIHTAQTPQNGSLHVFREGIAPEYDDPSNRTGGLFKLTLQASSCAVDAFAALSDSFVLGRLPHHSAVNGVTFAKKGTSCGLKVWVGSRQKHVVAHVQEWFTNELNGVMASCLHCPIESLLTSIRKREAAVSRSPQPPIQRPQEPNPMNALAGCQVPAAPAPTRTTATPSVQPFSLDLIMQAAKPTGDMTLLSLDLAEQPPASNRTSQVMPNATSFFSDGANSDMCESPSTAAVGYSSSEHILSSTFDTNDEARDSWLPWLTKCSAFSGDRRDPWDAVGWPSLLYGVQASDN